MKKIIISILISILFANNFALAAINEHDIEVTRENVVLNSKLKKKFVGYNYTIVNNTGKKINIVNAQIIKGNSGDLAYNEVEQGAGSSIGIVWAVAGPAGLFTLGIGWLAGIVATPIAWLVTNSSDKKAQRESVVYDNTVPIGYLNHTETLEVKTLVHKGATPQLKLTVMDIKTKELQTILK